MRPPVIHFSSKCYHANIRLIASLFLALASISACAKTIFPLQIVRTPQVAQQISTASPVERKQIEEAIRVGNKFINGRFDYADTDPEYWDENYWDDWRRDIGPLMAMDSVAWAKLWKKEGWKEHISYEKSGTGTLLACPSIQLEAVVPRAQSIHLRYRATLIGISVNTPRGLSMETSRRGQSYILEVGLNRNNRIASVHATENTVARAYQSEIKRYEYEGAAAERYGRKSARPYPQDINTIINAVGICADIEKSKITKEE